MKKIITTTALMMMSTSLMASVPVEGEEELPSIYRMHYSADSTLKVGNTVTVEWEAANADICKLDAGGPVWNIPDMGEKTITITETHMTITADCSNSNGYDTRQLSFTAQDVDHPVLNSFSVSPSSNVMAGMPLTVTWDSDYAQNCTLYGTYNQTLAASGSETFTAQQGTNSFNMVCNANDGRVSNSRSKNITAVSMRAPVVNVSVSNTRPPVGGFFYVSWNSQYAESCTLNGVPVALIGTKFESTLIPTDYVLQCQGLGGTAIDSASVTPSTQRG